MDIHLLTLDGAEKVTGNLKRGKATGSDGLTSEIFESGRPVLTVRLTEVLAKN